MQNIEFYYLMCEKYLISQKAKEIICIFPRGYFVESLNFSNHFDS